MLDAEALNETKVKIGRSWYIAEPLYGPFLHRLKDAYNVLMGKAHAVSFTKNDTVLYNFQRELSVLSHYITQFYRTFDALPYRMIREYPGDIDLIANIIASINNKVNVMMQTKYRGISIMRGKLPAQFYIMSSSYSIEIIGDIINFRTADIHSDIIDLTVDNIDSIDELFDIVSIKHSFMFLNSSIPNIIKLAVKRKHLN